MDRNTLKRTTSSSRPSNLNAGPYEAIVVSHLDPKYMGGLEVELLKNTTAGNLPERTGQMFEVRYLNPFYGVTPASALSKNPGYEYSQKSYGMWFVPPDAGTRVLVIFAEGNPAQGFWIGCIQDDYMNFMLPGYASTEFTDDDTPEEYNRKKLPVGEYNKTRFQDQRKPSIYKKPVHKPLVKQLLESGLIGDDSRGVTSSTARREVPSAVYGISTPGPVDKTTNDVKADIGPFGSKARVFANRLGGSSFVMDDGDDKILRKGSAKDTPYGYVNVEADDTDSEDFDVTIPHNECFRLKTRTGHQILLHNSEDLIYIANSRGTAWIELTSNGKIDMYAQDSMSFHTENDFNVTAGRDVNFTAEENVNVVAGRNAKTSAGKSFDISSGGRTSIITGADLSFSSNASLTASAKEAISVITESKGLTLASEESIMLKARGSLEFATDNSLKIGAKGDLHLSANGDLQAQSVTGTAHIKAGIDVRIQADESVHQLAGTSIFHQTEVGPINVKSAEKIFVEAVSDIHTKTEENIFTQALLNINTKATENIYTEAALNVYTKADQSIYTEAAVDTYIKAGASMFSEAASVMNLLAGANINQDGAAIRLNEGLAASSQPAELATEAELATNAIEARQAGVPNDAFEFFPANVAFTDGSQSLPGARALMAARVPQHEPWLQHENLNPLEFTPNKTRAGQQQVDILVDITEDTFVSVSTRTPKEKTEDKTSPRYSQDFGDGSFAGNSEPDDYEYTPLGIGEAGAQVQTAFTFFLDKGFTEPQAAGIVGSLVVESGEDLNPATTSDGGEAYGIAQWNRRYSPEREINFETAIGTALRGSSLEQQLEFIWLEMTGTPGDPGAQSAYARITALAATESIDSQIDIARKTAAIFDTDYGRSTGIDRNSRQMNGQTILINYLTGWDEAVSSIAPLDLSEDSSDLTASTNAGVGQINPQLTEDGNLTTRVVEAQAGIRNVPIHPTLKRILNEAAHKAGITEVRVVSGGQPPEPGTPRSGSSRHDNGRAADVDLYKDGKRLLGTDREDLAAQQAFIYAAVQAGARGVGHGKNYLSGADVYRFHIDFLGNRRSPVGLSWWGANGETSNVAAWVPEVMKEALRDNK